MSAISDRLYHLLPAIYRMRDSDQGEPLRALLSLIEKEYDGVEQDIGALYENWFIETCQEWVVPYIGIFWVFVRFIRPAPAPSANALMWPTRLAIVAAREQRPCWSNLPMT